MKVGRIIRTILTNWIHLIPFYVTTYLALLLYQVVGPPNQKLVQAIPFLFASTFLLFFIYGPVIMAGFYAAIVLADVLLFSCGYKRMREKLILEWILISTPFIYWAFKYEYWLWICLSASFLLTQLLRSVLIGRILNDDREAANFRRALH